MQVSLVRPAIRHLGQNILRKTNPTPSHSIRTFSQSTIVHKDDSNKPSIANIAQLRKLMPGTSMIKAKEALSATSNEIKQALAWLEKDLQITGAKKASKVSDREAKEGGVAVCIVTDGIPASNDPTAKQQDGLRFSPINLAARAGIVELNCETDFVGRNEIFQTLLADLAHTVALFPTLAIEEKASSSSSSSQEIIDISIPDLLEFPLIPRPVKGDNQESDTSTNVPKTVGNAILDLVSRLGERIHLARASSLSNVAPPSADAPRRSLSPQSSTAWNIASSFAHGASGTSSQSDGPQVSIGKVGSLLLTRIHKPSSEPDESSLTIVKSLARSLARQAAGMPTRSIEPKGTTEDAEESLYAQSFIMRLAASKLPEEVQQQSEQNVKQVLKAWGQAWVGSDSANAEEAVHVTAMRRWQVGEDLEGQS